MLIEKLKDYATSGVYPFHMPGHKRNPGFAGNSSFMALHKRNTAFCNAAGQVLPYGLDITELPGFDDLSDPQGVLLEIEKLAARLYGSRRAFLLVNGSTVGNLAAIGAHVKAGGKLIAGTGSHRSIPNASKLFGLRAIYIDEKKDEETGAYCSITPGDACAALRQNPQAKLVAITSPSYEGVVSDIQGIADVAHAAGALLLVDAAHGAHLGFSAKFPQNPTELGADIVVMSLHKTLPALTQCSLLHICSDRADTAAVKGMLGILQTSSPSYVLMASIDYCLRLLKTGADRLFGEYEGNLAYFYERVGGLRNLRVITRDGRPGGFFDFDPGKIVLCAKNSGEAVADILREKYNLQVEKATCDFAIAMTSICDTREGFARLADALAEIDNGRPDGN